MQHRYENVDYTKIKPIQKMSYQNRVNYFRTTMYQSLVSRLIEILPYLMEYENLPPSLSALQIESQLRISNQDLVIGLDKFERLVVLGRPVGLVNNASGYPIVTGIQFIIDEAQRLPRDEYVQIIPTNPDKGNYVLLRNRYNPGFKNDVEMIQDYAVNLAELKKSRYSLSLQANVLTYFKGIDVYDNNTINKLIDDMFEGAPVIKIESAINVNDDFGTMDNAKVIPAMLSATKDEYDNVFNEILNMIGVMNLGVDKASGVTSEEASANHGFLNAINNIYVKTRQDAFDLINNALGYDIQVSANHEVAHGIQAMGRKLREDEKSFGEKEKNVFENQLIKEGAK